jgi:hypothetical protein
METEVRNQSTKLAGQKIFAARNPAPIIPRALVLSRTHLSTRLILVEVTTRSIINQSRIGDWAGEEPAQFFVFLNTVDWRRAPACGSCSELRARRKDYFLTPVRIIHHDF